MVLRWLARLFAPRAPAFRPEWLPFLDRLPFYKALDEDGRRRLQVRAAALIAGKDWEGCGGLALTDEIRVTIAAQASLLLLHLDVVEFPGVHTILVYPSTFRPPPRQGQDGVVAGHATLGEAWQQGPVILAWDAARSGALDPTDGRNLVLHEFAHKLDMLDGAADGAPPQPGRAALQRWAQVMTAEFERLRRANDRGVPTLLDSYGAVNPAEFFAVATECFFERGAALRQRHPELYDVMRQWYRQDPARV
ncbi:MAG: zinc-dependent peptidase [Planctomycetota bacterium]